MNNNQIFSNLSNKERLIRKFWLIYFLAEIFFRFSQILISAFNDPTSVTSEAGLSKLAVTILPELIAIPILYWYFWASYIKAETFLLTLGIYVKGACCGLTLATIIFQNKTALLSQSTNPIDLLFGFVGLYLNWKLREVNRNIQKRHPEIFPKSP